jgi:glycosyltransferase involved in cell wall biosynthesis
MRTVSGPKFIYTMQQAKCLFNFMKRSNDANSSNSFKVIACIPAYNAGKSIGSVVTRAKKYVDMVLVVNDGSADNTRDQAEKAGAIVVNHSVNLGYGSAIMTCLKKGVEYGARIIITLDADLQHNPEEIPTLTRPIQEDICDIVTGSRFMTGNEISLLPQYRKFGIALLTKVTNFVAQTTISDATTGFRAYSNHAAKILASLPFSAGMGASSQILMEAFRSGLRIREVPVNILYHTGVDTSTQNSISMGMGILTSIIRYITIRRPLSLIGIPGLVILSVGIGSLFLMLDIFNATRNIPTGLGMFTVATAVLGLFLLMTSVILYTLSRILKGSSY